MGSLGNRQIAFRLLLFDILQTWQHRIDSNLFPETSSSIPFLLCSISLCYKLIVIIVPIKIKASIMCPENMLTMFFFCFFFLNLVRHFHLPVKMSVHQPAHYPFTLSRLTFALFFHDEWLIKMYFSSRSCPSADESVTYFKGKNDLDLRTWYTPLNIPRTTVSAWW